MLEIAGGIVLAVIFLFLLIVFADSIVMLIGFVLALAIALGLYLLAVELLGEQWIIIGITLAVIIWLPTKLWLSLKESRKRAENEERALFEEKTRTAQINREETQRQREKTRRKRIEASRNVAWWTALKAEAQARREADMTPREWAKDPRAAEWARKKREASEQDKRTEAKRAQRLTKLNQMDGNARTEEEK